MQVRVYPCAGPAVRRLAFRFALPTTAVAAVLTIALAPARAQDAVVFRGIDSSGITLSNPAPLKARAEAFVPTSSQVNPEDVGKKAHTNFRFLGPPITDPMELPPYSGYAYETPASLACHYGLVGVIAGCNPNSTVTDPTGGSQSIAIVDAFDDPEAPADLAYFSAVFGLPFNPSKFQVIYAGGVEPPVDFSGGWETEESLDIEYAHAMAPKATLYLVEAQSNSYTDLFTAVTVATNLIQCGSTSTTIGACGSISGKGEVSMSWGGGEFSGETAYDTYFNQTNVVFFASAGDSPGAIYPSTSPNVVSVGGTSIQRSPTTGNQIAEVAWPDGGSGPSGVEARPAYQTGPGVPAGTARLTPDVSSDANPYTGLWVYDSFPNDFGFSSVGWWIVGGTSASSPVWAGIVNSAGSFAASSTAELTALYGDLAGASYHSEFIDINTGFCYYYMGFNAAANYDQCTGIGAPYRTTGK